MTQLGPKLTFSVFTLILLLLTFSLIPPPPSQTLPPSLCLLRLSPTSPSSPFSTFSVSATLPTSPSPPPTSQPKMKRRNPNYGRPRPNPSRRPRGAVLTAEEDLSPDSSPSKNPTPDLVKSEPLPAPPSPAPDLVKSASPPPSSYLAGDDPRPWVKLRRRQLPFWCYRRLPNWCYPERTTHEPYFPDSWSVAKDSGIGVVAAGSSEATPAEDDSVQEAEEQVYMTIY